mgnify:FL=1|tara:strand:+ start:64 stop:423 length:360 start_codon:yes stop_codon:yes gene_type:complete
MKKIRFKINYEVKQKWKFEEFLDRYQDEIGLEFKELKIERYWKIKEQFQANFFIESDSTEKERKVYEILTWANKLWSTGYSNWTINGPHENESLIFECILNNDNDDQPLKWAHIEIENE